MGGGGWWGGGGGGGDELINMIRCWYNDTNVGRLANNPVIQMVH